MDISAIQSINQAILYVQNTQHTQYAQSLTSLNQTNLDKHPEIKSLWDALADVENKIQDIAKGLKHTLAQCGKDTIRKLETAMVQIYNLAVFIRGDYDDRDPDTAQRDKLLKLAVNAFQEAEDIAEAGLKAISDRHSQVMEMESTVIAPTKSKIDQMLQYAEIELQSVQSKIQVFERSIGLMQQTVANESAAMSRLSDRIDEMETVSLISDIGFTILTFGIGNAINGRPLDPANLHGQLKNARRAFNDAQNRLNEDRNRVSSLTSERNSLESQRNFTSQTSALIPELRAMATTTESECIMLQRQFGPLKEVSSRMLMRVREIEQGVTVMQALAYSKQEFAADILRICNESLIDQALVDEDRMVMNEVMREYGGDIPDEVQELAATIEGKMEFIATVPSICG
ncbi:hypothetical protein F4810DRAFT_723719 [Camillea tinctor]|nr:hypothetical protein F4810DRAFT_723719 [Camillea tinctor]